MSKNNNKGSYVFMLEGAKQPPKLLTDVKGIGNGLFVIKVIHPNTKEVLVQKEEKCKDILEALEKANQLKDSPEILATETWYQETLFIPNPKKGKVALQTKEVMEDELNAISLDIEEADFIEIDEDLPVETKKVNIKKEKKTKEKKSPTKNIKKPKTEAKKSKKNIKK